ncbi:acetolactate decarboxylase [Chitinophaga tropicalis]|uniref:Alpha-acetolactate decarboxylase n=1 Tax=Chitinophaga tropicalis TaxID=2683588 RepID=A0A7K1U3D8_9BACT|nr:acetolactate decarboxylase [Chitinophaga tropicalis]MVT08830.1 acetolactate decarboxylase [Chitinophaga tropicalis]
MYTRNIIAIIALLITILPGATKAAPPDTLHNRLFTVGVGSALIGGLYDGFYNYRSLKKHGDFGLGAPDKLDGELVVFQGKAYQTQHTGKTSVVNDLQLTSFAMVNFFHPDITITSGKEMDKASFFRFLDSILTNVNGMYAIHVHGKFKYLKTRAFPPVKEGQHTPLADMLNLQQFFEYKESSGDLIGYRLPAFMDNTNISGYHFHYLSAQKNAGGHMIDLATENITVEIDILDSYTVQVPATKDYGQFDFKKNRAEDIKSVERGGKKE